MSKKIALLLLLQLLLLPLHLQAEQAAAPSAAQPAAPTEASTPASVATASRKSSPTLQQWVNWLPPSLPPHEIEWLQENSVFSLYFPQQLAEAKGSVLLVPAAGQHAAWPDHIRALSGQLPAHGWSVLVVTPATVTPPPSATAAVTTTPETAAEPAGGNTPEVDEVAPATPAAEPASAPAATTEATTTKPVTAEPDNLAVLRAGLSLLESKGQKNTVVIGMGDGGLTALELVHKNMGTDNRVHGLILADLPEQARPAQKLAEIFRLHPIVVLDISHPAGRAAWRVRVSQLKQFPHYRAVLLPEPVASIQHSNDRLARRVRGWLTRYVSGEQKSGPAASGAGGGKP